MSKDPAFLFYSKDWIAGTAGMSPAEKGVYIDLLAYQHHHGKLPSDISKLSRMVSLPPDEFNEIWESIQPHFMSLNGGIVNLKLHKIIEERAAGAKKKRISGAFANYLKIADLNKDTTAQLRKAFSVNDFLQFMDDGMFDEVRYWCDKWVRNYEKGN